MRVALRAIPNLFFVTDAVAAAGMQDGEYQLGRTRIVKRGAAVYLAETGEGDAPVLAGSALTMDVVLRNLLTLGLELDDAVRRISLLPAQFIGVDDRGRLDVGAWADIVTLDPDGAVRCVYVEGEKVARDATGSGG